MRTIFTILSVLALTSWVSAQAQYFRKADKAAIQVSAQGRREIFVDKAEVFSVSASALKAALQRAPMEYTKARSKALELSLPLPDGSFVTLEVEESPVMAPELQARYPQVRTYRATSKEGYYARLGFSQFGFHASIYTPKKEEIFIHPYAEGDDRYVQVYYTRDYHAQYGFGIDCGHDRVKVEGEDKTHEHEVIRSAGESIQGARGENVTLLTYRMALACTGEYGEAQGGNKDNVIARFAEAMNRMNVIYEQENAIRFQLIPNNDKLIFLNRFTDEYDFDGTGIGLLGQNQTALDKLIGSANYDIGHVFTTTCSDVGGVVSGRVCNTNGKGRGVTCISGSITSAVNRIMSHEVGHQFSAGHSWNNCPAYLGQLASGSAFEPGSGSTIMSYAGSCGDQNISGDNDVYFHVGSLVQISEHARIVTSCATPTVVDNRKPDVTLNYTNGFFIPIGTPFKLEANATDPENDPITYCWEQYDLGPTSSIGSPSLDAPLFRSYPPTTNRTRFFPTISTIVAGNFNKTEVLPTYSRNLTFRVTVRDNHTGPSGVIWEEIKFKSSAQAGPFVLTYPNSDTVQWKIGEKRIITWDVANTDKTPVNCKFVNIHLYRVNSNPGLAPVVYLTTLAANVPNDGSHEIVVPSYNGTAFRVWIEAADNIFFDISNRNFSIKAPDNPGFAFTPSPFTQQVCVPRNEVTVKLNTFSFLGYDSTLTVQVNGLPSDVSYSLTESVTIPSKSNSIKFDFTKTAFNGNLPVEIVLFGPQADTVRSTIIFNVVNNDFSDFALVSPLNGEAGLSELPTLTWVQAANADGFEIQIATSPAFGGSIVDQRADLKTASYVLGKILQKSRLYYWRVRPLNECGEGPWSETRLFGTEVQNCASFSNKDIVFMPGAGAPTISSRINISNAGNVSDVNVGPIRFNISNLRDLALFLTSNGDTVLLLNQPLCATTAFSSGFDDQSPAALPCPPTPGGFYKPLASLSKFNGNPAAGEWKLHIRDASGKAQDGSLSEWNLQVCTNAALSPPANQVNKVLVVQAGGEGLISKDLLESVDPDDAADKLIYTLISIPQRGDLLIDNIPAAIGNTFSQADINNGRLKYLNTRVDLNTDFFLFAVSDGKGGFYGVSTFNIEIQPVSAKNINTFPMAVFPNPVQEWVTVTWENTGAATTLDLEVYHLNGQRMLQKQLNAAQQKELFSVQQWPAGIYLVKIANDSQQAIQRITVQHP